MLKKIKTFCFDVDNTICRTKGSCYSRSKPINKAVKIINLLHKEGHIIKLYTARYMGRNKDSVLKSKKQGLNLIVKQLKKWGVNYKSLHMGKPSFDFLIDDKSIFFKKNWPNFMYNIAMIRFVKEYTSDVKKLLDESISKNITEIENLKNSFLSCKKKKSKIILVGNGGSAATSSHVAVDLTKNAKLRSINFNEADLITCFANDFGYENWIEKALEMYCDKNDFVVLLSASGKSKNILKAALWLKNKKIKFATFSGMEKKNILKRINFNGINVWINSMSYNKVEILHHYILLLIVDLIIKKPEYKK